MRKFINIVEAAMSGKPSVLYHGTTPYNAALIHLAGTIEMNESRDEDEYLGHSICTSEKKEVAEWFYDVVRAVEQPFGFVFTIDTSKLDELRPFESETASQPEYEWRVYEEIDVETSVTSLHIVGYKTLERGEIEQYVSTMERGYRYEHSYDQEEIVDTLIELIEKCGGHVDDDHKDGIEIETTTIHAGTALYHGTDDDDFVLTKGLWVSNDLSVCEEFIRRNGGNGGTPRILAFEVIRDIELPSFEDSDQFSDYLERHDISTYGSEDMRDDAIRAGIDGWVIPHNYGHNKADIFITNAPQVLRPRGSKSPPS